MKRSHRPDTSETRDTTHLLPCTGDSKVCLPSPVDGNHNNEERPASLSLLQRGARPAWQTRHRYQLAGSLEPSPSQRTRFSPYRIPLGGISPASASADSARAPALAGSVAVTVCERASVTFWVHVGADCADARSADCSSCAVLPQFDQSSQQLGSPPIIRESACTSRADLPSRWTARSPACCTSRLHTWLLAADCGWEAENTLFPIRRSTLAWISPLFRY